VRQLGFSEVFYFVGRRGSGLEFCTFLRVDLRAKKMICMSCILLEITVLGDIEKFDISNIFYLMLLHQYLKNTRNIIFIIFSRSWM
jgi:hypothetical protein